MVLSGIGRKMVIRAAQIEALRADLLLRELVRYARSRFPERFRDASPPEVLDLCAEVLRTTRRYGIDEATDIATVLDLTVMYGAGFPDSEWARDVFATQALGPGEKIAVLRSRVRRQVDGL
jgi:hypothetical protein